MVPPLERMISQTENQVESLDLEELLTLSEDEDISLTGCDSIDEIKLRLIHGINRNRQRAETHSLWNDQRQSQLKAENEHKRNELARIFKSTETSLLDSLPHLNNILTQEGSNTDLSRDIIKRMSVLQKGECNVLFAGETNAGKSTLLNLLLGVHILPKSILSCTSGICKLSFSPTYTVIVVHRDGREETRSFSDDKGTRNFLEQTVAQQGEKSRELGPSFKEVHVLLPANILKSGITIIDSPGIGENEAMDTVARDFVSNNDVAAFIYIIKTDNSGGVQEDRLIAFLKSILNIKMDQSDDSQYFDPKAAMFVCNRWDLIQDEDKSKVRDNALGRLRTVWPDLEEAQVCFLSSKAGEASEGWDILHQSLDDIFQLARQVVIMNAFCWLKHIVRESAFCLRAIVSQANGKEYEFQKKLSSATSRLATLSTEARNAMDSLKLGLQRDAVVFQKNLMELLASANFQRNLEQWEVEDIPEFHANRTNCTSLNRDEIIIERIMDILDSSEITRKFIEDFVNVKMHKELLKLGSNMESIEDDLKESRNSIRLSMSSEKCDRFYISVIRQFVCDKRLGSFVTKSTPSGIVSFGELSRTVVRKVTKVVSRRQSVPDLRNPVTETTTRAKRIAKKISTSDEISRYLASRYTTQIENEVNKIALRVPKFVQGIQRLIAEITSLSSQTQVKRNDLQKTMEQLEQQKELVRGYGHLYVQDILVDDIMMCLDDPRLKTSSQVKVDIDDDRPDYLSQVLWTRFQKGTLSLDDVNESITVRYYINQPADNHLYREIAKLRCLDHFSVGKFLGMTRAESQSAFIFLEELTTARHYLRRPVSDETCTYTLRKAIPGLVEGLVEGLEYIHKDGLVHMELNADTVMVNRHGEVKLIGMCLPRLGKFPLDRDSIEVGDFTCLSPEVLGGDVYTREADVYSLGLLVAEILLPERPFKDERTWSLARFISSVSPTEMLDIPDSSYSKPLHTILKGCLIPRPYQRLSIPEIRDLVQELKTDKLFETFGLTRRMTSRRPSALWSEDVMKELERQAT